VAILKASVFLAASVCLVLALVACRGKARSGHSGNTMIVLDHSMGGVALREKRADVERRLGRGFVLHTNDQRPPEPPLHEEDVLYAKDGLEVFYVSRNATQVSRERGLAVVLLTHSPRYKTPEGVHVGSTAAELRTIKDVKCNDPANLDCQHGGQVHNQPGTMFRLSEPGAVVVRIAIAYSD
jgi:hypothetical protein